MKLREDMSLRVFKNVSERWQIPSSRFLRPKSRPMGWAEENLREPCQILFQSGQRLEGRYPPMHVHGSSWAARRRGDSDLHGGGAPFRLIVPGIREPARLSSASCPRLSAIKPASCVRASAAAHAPWDCAPAHTREQLPAAPRIRPGARRGSLAAREKRFTCGVCVCVRAAEMGRGKHVTGRVPPAHLKSAATCFSLLCKSSQKQQMSFTLPSIHNMQNHPLAVPHPGPLRARARPGDAVSLAEARSFSLPLAARPLSQHPRLQRFSREHMRPGGERGAHAPPATQ